MSEHTPGPLKVTTSCGGHQTVIACDKPGPQASHALGYTVCRHGRGLYTAEANARLWAAAPDLLAACEGLLVSYLENARTADGAPFACPEAVSCVIAAREAIAKAKGDADEAT